MKKLPPRKCKHCGKSFVPKSARHIFDSRRCFKLADYRRHKDITKNKFPIFKCPSCDNVITLDFNPVKKPETWLKFKCPHCNTLMICVFDDIKTIDTQSE